MNFYKKMGSFLTIKLMGGLGNYMFQIASTYSKSLDLNFQFLINPDESITVHKKYEHYINNIFRKIKTGNFNTTQNYFEPVFNYREIPSFMLSTKLNGYFQSEKYFIHNRKKIIELFECSEDLKNKLYKKYPQINNETCSIHVRRGDYVNLQDHHPLQPIEYYKTAINLIGDNKTYFIFSDDIEWCKLNFGFLNNVVFVDGNEDYEDLYLMSFCKNNIMANSSFSWWGAWLNDNKNKKVIAPKKWFGVKNSSLNLDDLYFEKTIVI